MPYRESAADDGFVVSVFMGRVLALDLQSGKARWEWSNGTVDRAQLRAGAGRVFHLAGGQLTALDATSGTLLWSTTVPLDLDAKPPQLELAGDAILVSHGGILHCYAREDGAGRWRVRSSDFQMVT